MLPPEHTKTYQLLTIALLPIARGALWRFIKEMEALVSKLNFW